MEKYKSQHEGNVIENDFKQIFSLKNAPTSRNYIKTADRVVESLNENNWHSPLIIKGLVFQIEKAIEECQKIEKKNENPLVAGYDVMARIGRLETGLKDLADRIKDKDGFGKLEDLKAEFKVQKDVAEEIAKLVEHEDGAMVEA